MGQQRMQIIIVSSFPGAGLQKSLRITAQVWLTTSAGRVPTCRFAQSWCLDTQVGRACQDKPGTGLKSGFKGMAAEIWAFEFAPARLFD